MGKVMALATYAHLIMIALSAVLLASQSKHGIRLPAGATTACLGDGAGLRRPAHDGQLCTFTLS